jgi:hypothetical protein
MEEVLRQFEQAGCKDTVKQIQKELKTTKLKKGQLDVMVKELLKSVKKIGKEESKQPFGYPRKEVNRGKMVQQKPVDQKTLEKFLNKMVNRNNLDEVKTKFEEEDRVFKTKAFQRLSKLGQLIPDADKPFVSGKENVHEKEDRGDSISGFAPASLDGSSHISGQFEHYKNYSYVKGDSSLPISDMKLSSNDNSKFDSFVNPAKSDTSKILENFKGKLGDSDVHVSGIKKVEQSYDDQTNKSWLNAIEEKEELIDEYDDNDDPGFMIIEAGESDFMDKCKEVAEKYNFPAVSVKPPDELDLKFEEERMKKLEEERLKEDETVNKKSKKKVDSDKLALKKALGYVEEESEAESDESIPTNLPKWVKFVPCEDEFYPAEFNGVVYD